MTAQRVRTTQFADSRELARGIAELEDSIAHLDERLERRRLEQAHRLQPSSSRRGEEPSPATPSTPSTMSLASAPAGSVPSRRRPPVGPLPTTQKTPMPTNRVRSPAVLHRAAVRPPACSSASGMKMQPTVEGGGALASRSPSPMFNRKSSHAEPQSVPQHYLPPSNYIPVPRPVVPYISAIPSRTNAPPIFLEWKVPPVIRQFQPVVGLQV